MGVIDPITTYWDDPPSILGTEKHQGEINSWTPRLENPDQKLGITVECTKTQIPIQLRNKKINGLFWFW